MLSFQDKSKYVDYIARIVSQAVAAKIHLQVITDKLFQSSFIDEFERGQNSLIVSKTPYELFVDVFGIGYTTDNSFMNFNDAYWCGYVYAQLFFEYKKPLSYIALKMPLERLLNMYSVYHEMDISQIFEIFKEAEEKETIVKLLLNKHSITAAELSRTSGIALRTLARFKENDEYLYKGSFNNVYSLARTLNEPAKLFLREIKEG